MIKKYINIKTFPRLMNWRARIKKYFIPKHFKNVSDIDIAPVFIAGTNRSGGSLISSLLGQHPLLENVSEDDGKIRMVGGHTGGFSDSSHLWPWLDDYTLDPFVQKGEGFLWGHPKFISQIYRDDIISDAEKLRIANHLQMGRKTNHPPMIKHAIYSLRIGLWKQVFPNAKFVFNFRDYNEYIVSNKQKWKINSKVGLHWYNLNSTVYYDLMQYYPNSFTMINHNDLYRKSSDEVQALLNNVFKDLGLPPHEVDLKYIDPKYKFVTGLEDVPYKFDLIENISQFERSPDSNLDNK